MSDNIFTRFKLNKYCIQDFQNYLWSITILAQLFYIIIRLSKLNSMGASIGSGCFRNPYIEPATMLENPFLIPLKNIVSYTFPKFIVYKADNRDTTDVVNFLTQNSYTVQTFQTIEALKDYHDDSFLNILVICSSNPLAVQINLPNYSIYQSIYFVTNNPVQVTEQQKITLRARYTYRFKQIIQAKPQNFKKCFHLGNFHRSAYFCNQDRNLINQANLVFHLYITGNLKKHSPQLFIDYLNSKGQKGTAFAEKIRKIQTNPQKVGQKILKYFVRNDQLVVELIEMLTKTKNPGVMPHFSWAYTCLSNFIRIQGNFQKGQDKNDFFYIVENISETDKQLFINSTNHNFMFSTFKIGYSNYEEACNIKRQQKANMLFIVVIPDNTEEFLESVDFGFYVYEGKAVFNVQNFFNIAEINTDKDQITIKYGSLAKQYTHKQQQERFIALFSNQYNLPMLKLWDYYIYNRQFVTNQMDLILSLQMYYKFQQIIQENPRQTEYGFNIYGVTMAQKIGDCYLQIGNRQEAMRIYETVLSPPERSKVKILNHLNIFTQDKQYYDILQELQKIRPQQIKSNNKFLFVQIQYFQILMLIKNKNPKQAQKMIEKQMKLMMEKFKEFLKQLKTNYFIFQCFPFYNLMIQTQIVLTPIKINQIEEQLNFAQLINDATKEKQQRRKLSAARQRCQSKKREYAQNLPIFEGTHIYWLP